MLAQPADMPSEKAHSHKDHPNDPDKWEPLFTEGAEEAEKQIVSRERVANHAEVYTGKREVKAMLDLVQQETERIDSKFLEPACGTGNFLVEILERKLRIVTKRYKKSN